MRVGNTNILGASIFIYVPDPKMEGNCGPIFIHFWKLVTLMIFQSKSEWKWHIFLYSDQNE